MVPVRYSLLALALSTPLPAMRMSVKEVTEQHDEQKAAMEIEGKETTATIAGVPVLNYHLAYQGKSYQHLKPRHPDHRQFASLVREANDTVEKQEEEENWVIVLKTDISEERIHEACRKATAKCTLEGHALGQGFPFIALRGTEKELGEVLHLTGGARFVEVDIPVRMVPEIEVKSSLGSGDQLQAKISLGGDASAPARPFQPQSDPLAPTTGTRGWHLPHMGTGKRVTTGRGVHVFVLDTGVLTTHSEFQGRAIPFAETAVSFFWETPKGLCNSAADCAVDRQGHGTHCAGTVGGKTWGVAPEASLYAVKTLGDDGAGGISSIISGMDLAASSSRKPAILSMSLGGPGSDRGIREAIDTVVNTNGVTVVVAAGNEFADACDGLLPSSPHAITVGATSPANERAGFSNWGSCVDIFAPGTDIVSAGLDLSKDQGTASFSGTSMACPAVAGAAALLLEADLALTPADVRAGLLTNAGSNYVNNLSPKDKAPNKLLYVGNDAPPVAKAQAPEDTKLWPTSDYWAACSDKGAVVSSKPTDVFKDSSEFTEHQCVCKEAGTCRRCPPGSSCEVGKQCPLGEALQNYVDRNPDAAGSIVGTLFVWNCTDCQCSAASKDFTSGLRLPALLMLALLSFANAQ